MSVNVASVDDVIAVATCSLGYVPRDAYVGLVLESGVLGGSAALAVEAGLDAGELGRVFGGLPMAGERSVLLMLGFGDTGLDLSDVAVVEQMCEFAPVVWSVQVRDGRYRVAGQRQWTPVGISEAGVQFDTPAPDREQLCAQVAPGQNPWPPVAAPEDAPGRLRAEDAALDAVLTAGLPVEQVAAALWAVCQDVRSRDPFIARLLDTDRDAQRGALDAVHAVVRHTTADAQVYAVAALLSWAIGGSTVTATECARHAQQHQPTTQLADLVARAIDTGLSPNTWKDLTADIPLHTMRAGASPIPG